MTGGTVGSNDNAADILLFKVNYTAEPRSFSFLMQRLSVAVQRGNAVCVTGTAPSTSSLDKDVALL